MRFTMTHDGAERLGLDPNKVCREFDGPPTREGLTGGFPRGVIGWAKKQLKVAAITDLDVMEARLLYYVISMRNVDHTLLPISRFDDLALTDFELIKHKVPGLDRDGDCAECSMDLEHPVHLDPEDEDEAVLRPTTAPAGPETSATPTT